MLRVQYPDVLAKRGFQLIHPMTGEQYSNDRRHLIAACRAVSNFALGTAIDGPDWCRDAVKHGIHFLREAHRSPDGGYHLLVDSDGKPIDRTRSAYGHAFVLLAYSRAATIGIDGATSDLRRTHQVIEERLRDNEGLLRSDCDPDWSELEAYRGQNANMHACEAYIAAYEATGEDRFLDRARHIAKTITVDLAEETDGLLWEHYSAEWDHDFEYNADEPRHQFQPPGYQPGHHAEWAKLLGLLDRYSDDTVDGDWQYARAVELFDAAVEMGWAEDGFVYTINRDGKTIVPDRYGWALAEALGAAATLKERADACGVADERDRFRNWEQRFLEEVPTYRGPAGVWYEKRLSPENGGIPVAPDAPGVEPDYHPVSAYYEEHRSTREVHRRA
ncbi:AGE family epimerase/isomerase [Halocatena salina]|uniref:AGE family epimerase/isomerase n=1 Tax=Halocatena salina TaxID=2934340 RepID=A0A8U0A6Y3_9EURY|nr:AGE family epimerase/isomerase [Halocatena salina]UPM44951.1 AGE family epimerase/isomerase [Halocatena salina]